MIIRRTKFLKFKKDHKKPHRSLFSSLIFCLERQQSTETSHKFTLFPEKAILKVTCLNLHMCISIEKRGHRFSMYAKLSEKLISYPLIRTRTCAYQGVRNVSFSESLGYVLNALLLRG